MKCKCVIINSNSIFCFFHTYIFPLFLCFVCRKRRTEGWKSYYGKLFTLPLAIEEINEVKQSINIIQWIFFFFGQGAKLDMRLKEQLVFGRKKQTNTERGLQCASHSCLGIRVSCCELLKACVGAMCTATTTLPHYHTTTSLFCHHCLAASELLLNAWRKRVLVWWKSLVSVDDDGGGGNDSSSSSSSSSSSVSLPFLLSIFSLLLLLLLLLLLSSPRPSSSLHSLHRGQKDFH